MKLQIIQTKIYEIRGHRVMLDFDLAELYDVETRVLNQSVKRSKSRFPPDFMFQLTTKEFKFLTSQFVMSNENTPFTKSSLVSQSVISKRGGRQKLPFAFTEHGITMLASVLRSDKAIKMNIAIVRAFIALREFALTYKELAEKISLLEHKNNKKFADIYEALDLLLEEKQNADDMKNRKRIGFK